MKSPLYNSLAKVLKKLHDNGFVSRYADEFKKIMSWAFEESFTNRQNFILRKIFTLYLNQLQPILTFNEVLQILNIPLLPHNIETIRHKLYNVFSTQSLNKIRLDLWNDEDLFHPFDDNSDSVKSYVMKSTHILKVLNNYMPKYLVPCEDMMLDLSFENGSINYQPNPNSIFTSKNFANDLNIDNRSADYQLKTNLIPLGFVKLEKVHSHLERGRYEEFSLTQMGINFLKYVFS